MKIALVTGITGQDGAYLARLLLEKGYNVHGLQPRCEVDNTLRLKNILQHPRLYMHEGDLADGGNIFRLMHDLQPDEIYNLGAQSHVGASFAAPEATANINALGTLRLLEAMRSLKSTARFYQASSSELFGNAPAPQNEETPMHPRSPYACAKLYAYWSVRNYREAYGLHASNGILFNHESPLRGEDFVTRKVTQAVAEIASGTREFISLGNLEARRDWGHARDYVHGMWQMLQQETPDDYVLATGKTYSVRRLVEVAFEMISRKIIWRGAGVHEWGVDSASGKVLVTIDAALYRPNEVDILRGDASKARKLLGWKAQTSFEDLIHEMLREDLHRVTRTYAGEIRNDYDFFKRAA